MPTSKPPGPKNPPDDTTEPNRPAAARGPFDEDSLGPMWDDKTMQSPAAKAIEVMATMEAPAPRPPDGSSWEEVARRSAAPTPAATNNDANRRTYGWANPPPPGAGVTPQAKAAADKAAEIAGTRPTAPALGGLPPRAQGAGPLAPSGSFSTLPPNAAQPAPVDSVVGSVFADRYRIIKKLGEGGMGIVYLAEHINIEKRVALKVLSEDFARKQELVQRFMQEAKAAARIGHENIVDITDFGETPSGSVFFAMEYLEGKDLAVALRDGGPMSFQRARHIAMQICRALGAAHAKGIIHRDMKPENVFLIEREGRADFVKILDFGIAKMNTLDEGGARLTRTGMIFGTPEYMSPEQARGDKPDHRVDIYAVGCILYEMLTGDVPFRADTFMGVLTKHMFEQPEPIALRAPTVQIAPDVEAVTMKALAKDRDLRFQTMKEMSVALAACGGMNANEGWGDEPSSVLTPEGVLSGQSSMMRSAGTSSGLRTAGTAAAMAVRENSGRVTLPQDASKKGAPVALVVVLLLLLVAGAGGAVYFVIKSRQPVQPAQITQPVATTAEPVKPPAEPPAPTEVQLTIQSMPDQAQVRTVAGEDLGTTTITRKFPISDKPITIILHKAGYKDATKDILPTKDRDYEIQLEALPKQSKPSKPEHGSSHRPLPRPPEAPATSTAKPATPTTHQNPKLRDLKDPFSTP